MKNPVVQPALTKYSFLKQCFFRAFQRRIVSCGVLAFLTVLAGCSSTDSYLQAKTLPPIAVPEGLDSQTLGQIYAVPEGDGRIAAGEFKNPFPPTLVARQETSVPTVETFNQQHWLLVPEEASVVWSQLLNFLQQRQIKVVRRDLSQATIETDWFAQAAQPGVVHRYRLRLESALRPNATEVHLQNIQGRVGDTANANTVLWPHDLQAQSQSPGHEKWLLNDMAKAMSSVNKTGDSLLASTINLPDKVQTVSDNGEPVLDFSLTQDRVYDALNQAVRHPTQDAFVVYDVSQAENTFHINEIIHREKKKSFFRKIGGFIGVSSDSKQVVTSRYQLEEILANLPDDESVKALFPQVKAGKRLSKVPGYLLVLRTTESAQRVYVRDAYGRPLPVVKAKQLIESIKRQLR